MPNKTKKLIFLLILFTAMAMCLVAQGFSSGEMPVKSDYETIWIGSLVNEDVAVELATEAADGRTIFNFHYGVPYNCILTAEEVRFEGKVRILRIFENSGGKKCDGLWQGTMELILSGPEQLMVTIFSKNGAKADVARLNKQK